MPAAGRKFKREVSRRALQVLRWGDAHVPPGARLPLGLLLMVGGVFGFLPVLGFWMLPLGLALAALDVPPARRRVRRWMQRMQADQS